MPSLSRSVVFAGGGSGGHLYPALAVARALLTPVPRNVTLTDPGPSAIPNDEPMRRVCDQVTFLTSDREIDQFIMERAITELPDIRWEPYFPHRRGAESVRLVRHGMASWTAWRAARRMIRVNRPQLCIGIGAVASVPAVLACAQAGVPVILMEQNTVPGRSTRWLSRFAKAVLAGLPIGQQYLHTLRCPVQVTGVPVRTEIAGLMQNSAAIAGDQCVDRRPAGRLLILGGSQGAASLNELIARVIVQRNGLPEHWKLTHQTGQRDQLRIQSLYATKTDQIEVVDFLQDMAHELSHADLVICRSGAGTLAELACAGRPSILIPLPGSASAHQLENARFFERAGAATIIEQTQADAETRLTSEIRRLTHSAATRQFMASRAVELARPEAVYNVLGRITEFLTGPMH